MLLSSQYPAAVRRNFYYDLVSGLFFGLYFGGINTFVLIQARRMGISPLWVSFLAALPSAWLLFSPLWTRLFGRMNPFTGILIFDGTSRLLLVLLLFSSNPVWYIFIFSLHYLVASVSATIYGNAMRLAYPSGARGQLMGWVRIGVSLTTIVSTSLAGMLLPVWGAQRFFAASAFLGFFSAFCFSRLKPAGVETIAEKAKTGRAFSFQVLRRNPDFCTFIVALFFVGMGNWVATPLYAIYQVDVLKLSDRFVSLMSVITSFSAVISYYIWGRYLDRRHPLTISTWLFFFHLFVPLIYFFSKKTWALSAIALIKGIVNAGGDLTLLNTVLGLAEGEEISSYMGIHIALQGARGMIGPFLGPLLLPVIDFRGVFLLTFLVTVIGVTLSLLRQRYRAEKNVPTRIG